MQIKAEVPASPLEFAQQTNREAQMDQHTSFRFRYLAPLLAFLVLAACAEPGTYPVSGEQCTPEDPVHDLSAASCMPI